MRLTFALVALAALAGCDSTDLARCDDAIKATLKAPASYHRVSTDGISGAFWAIEYDAVNLYNAPIRAKGTCYIDGDKVQWLELSRSSDTPSP